MPSAIVTRDQLQDPVTTLSTKTSVTVGPVKSLGIASRALVLLLLAQSSGRLWPSRTVFNIHELDAACKVVITSDAR